MVYVFIDAFLLFQNPFSSVRMIQIDKTVLKSLNVCKL